jgi:hypothetical protein
VQLCNRFIPTSRSLRKQVIDDHTTDGEEEDEQAPKKLVDWWAGGFEDLNYIWCQHSSAARLGLDPMIKALGWSSDWGRHGGKRKAY